MIIRILPQLEQAHQWQDFMQREQRYCYVNEPEVLVDMQSNHLMITLLGRKVVNGRQAIKYSIGAKSSPEPTASFIAHCRYSLSYMLYLLEQLDFSQTVLNNPGFAFSRELTIRRFHARDREIFSPSLLSSLEPLPAWPESWSLAALLSVLANKQYHYLFGSRYMQGTRVAPRLDGLALMLSIMDSPSRYKVKPLEEELFINKDGEPFAVLMPKLPGGLPRPQLEAQPNIDKEIMPTLPAAGGRDYLN